MTMEQIIHLAKHGAADSAVAAFQNLLSVSTEKPAKRPPVSGDSMTSVAALKIRQNVAAPLRQCNMLIKEMADAGQFDRCADVLRAMQSAGVRPSIVTYSTLISRAGAWQKVAVAERYFNQMKHDGIKADVQAYNSLINAYAKETETDRALAVLAEMDREQVKPTVVTFNTLIDSCARSGEVHKAEDMLKRMKVRLFICAVHVHRIDTVADNLRIELSTLLL
jgi:pentatricopeptide repeat protein